MNELCTRSKDKQNILTGLGNTNIIKSPRYTGGDFICFCTGSYAAAAAAAGAAAAADSCPRDNFWTTFWISFIFSTIVGPDL